MIIKAPDDFSDAPHPSIFLAGSIEMGAAVDWQDAVSRMLSKSGFTVLSPRREDFDVTQEQSIKNDYFREQVEWELRALEQCDCALMYFAPDTKSPVSLLELGLFYDKLIVCCPVGYWRKGNVDIVCARYAIPTAPTLDESTQMLIEEWLP